MFNSFGSGGPLPPPIFNGTYAFYPFATNGNNTVTAGVKINERLGDKIFNNDPGNLVTVGEYETAYTGSGELDEPSATTQIVTDMSAWDDLTNSTVTYNDTTKENRWLFTGGDVSHRAFTNSTAILSGEDYTLSLDVKKGESQFLQITGSSGFDGGIVVNYDLVNGIANDQGTGPTLKDFGLFDLGDYFRVYFTAESIDSGLSRRLILSKANSLNTARLQPSSDSGQFTVKYPNFVQASYASSPIDAPLAPATRDSDKAAVPTSDVWVDDGCFSGTLTSGSFNNGVSRTSNSEFTIAFDGDGKYAGKITAAVIGSVLLNNPQFTVTLNVSNSRVRASHNNLTEQELIDLFGNDGTSTNKYPIAWHYSTLTLAEVTQLRADVNDTPEAKVPSPFVDDGCFSSGNNTGGYIKGVQRINDSIFNINFNDPTLIQGKLRGLITSNMAGAVLLNSPLYAVLSTLNASIMQVSHPNNTKEELESLFGNDGTSSNKYEVNWEPSSLTEAEAIQLRTDVGDTEADWGLLGKWLTWPAEDVVFELDFTLYSNDPNELLHIEWANAAKDTYVARTGDALEFNHGNDTLTIPYANLIVLGDTYKGHAVITATELIGYVNGVEVARMTRTDTALAEWSSKCYFGGFNDTLAPVKLAKLKVSDYVAPPPVGSQLIVGDFSPLSGTAGDSALLPDGALGSLLPPVLVDGLAINFIQSVVNDFGGGAKKWVLCGNNTQDFTTNLTLTFNGTSYSFVRGAIALNPNTNAIQSDALYDFLTVNQNVSVDFTAEATASQGSQLIVEDFSAQGGAGAVAYDLDGSFTGQTEGSLSPSITLPDFGIVKTIVSLDSGTDPKIIVMQFEVTFPSNPVLAVFNGIPYTFTFNPSFGYTVESDVLYDFLTANQNTPIDFTAEVATDFADNGDFANNGDFA